VLEKGRIVADGKKSDVIRALRTIQKST
jgi:hypothetical protein